MILHYYEGQSVYWHFKMNVVYLTNLIIYFEHFFVLKEYLLAKRIYIKEVICEIKRVNKEAIFERKV